MAGIGELGRARNMKNIKAWIDEVSESVDDGRERN
jgi:hypothetical protein